MAYSARQAGTGLTRATASFAFAGAAAITPEDLPATTVEKVRTSVRL